MKNYIKNEVAYTKVMKKDFLNSLFEYSDGMIFRKKSSPGKKAGSRAGCLHHGAGKGYRYVKMNKVYFSEHRIIYTMINGEIPPDICIDHKDGDTLNNNIDNLRPATISENMQNRLEWVMLKSGVKGVYKNKNRWASRIEKDGTSYYLGTFDTKELAFAAYQGAAIVLHGEFANFGRTKYNKTLKK